jgi:hypothetical protein
MDDNQPVTEAQIYSANVLAYAKQGRFAEIRREHPAWASWRSYFRQLDHTALLNVMQAMERRVWIGKHGLMVPTDWPDQFDPKAPRVQPDELGQD